jgi:hypothetical protein
MKKNNKWSDFLTSLYHSYGCSRTSVRKILSFPPHEQPQLILKKQILKMLLYPFYQWNYGAKGFTCASCCFTRNRHLIFMKDLLCTADPVGNWYFLWNHCTASLWRY